MATFIEHVRVNRHRVRGARVPLLAVSPNRACPQHILFLSPPDGYGVLRAPAIPMPHLDDSLGVLLRRNLGLVVQAFWVVSRPHLQGDDGGAPLSYIMIQVGETHRRWSVTVEMERAMALQREEPGWCGS